MRMIIFAIFHSSVCAGKVDGNNVTSSTAACEQTKNCVQLCCESERECDQNYKNFDDFKRYLSTVNVNYELRFGKPCQKMHNYTKKWSLEVRKCEKVFLNANLNFKKIFRRTE